MNLTPFHPVRESLEIVSRSVPVEIPDGPIWSLSNVVPTAAIVLRGRRAPRRTGSETFL